MSLTVTSMIVMAGVSLSAAQPPATSSAPANRRWEVSVCAPYLAGLAEDVWSAGRAVGITRLEVYLDQQLACPHLYEKGTTPYRIDTPAGCEALKRKLAAEKFSIGCLAIVTRLEADGSADAAALGRVHKAAAAAPGLGCPIIMLPIGVNPPKDGKLTDELFLARVRPFIKAMDTIAAEARVQIVIENLGHYWNRPEIIEPALRESTPDRVGLLLDITNMYWFGHPLDRLPELAARFAPYVRYVHVKSIRYPQDKRNAERSPGWEYGKYAEPIPSGDVDFHRIITILHKAGYVGDLTIEDDSLPHFDVAGKKKVLAEDAKYLRGLWPLIEK